VTGVAGCGHAAQPRGRIDHTLASLAVGDTETGDTVKQPGGSSDRLAASAGWSDATALPRPGTRSRRSVGEGKEATRTAILVHMCVEREQSLAEGLPLQRATWRESATVIVDALYGLLPGPFWRSAANPATTRHDDLSD
jgi:hypothetical protein